MNIRQFAKFGDLCRFCGIWNFQLVEKYFFELSDYFHLETVRGWIYTVDMDRSEPPWTRDVTAIKDVIDI